MKNQTVTTYQKKHLVKTYDQACELFREKTSQKFPPNIPTPENIFETNSKRFPFFVGTRAEWAGY